MREFTVLQYHQWLPFSGEVVRFPGPGHAPGQDLDIGAGVDLVHGREAAAPTVRVRIPAIAEGVDPAVENLAPDPAETVTKQSFSNMACKRKCND